MVPSKVKERDLFARKCSFVEANAIQRNKTTEYWMKASNCLNADEMNGNEAQSPIAIYDDKYPYWEANERKTEWMKYTRTATTTTTTSMKHLEQQPLFSVNEITTTTTTMMM